MPRRRWAPPHQACVRELVQVRQRLSSDGIELLAKFEFQCDLILRIGEAQNEVRFGSLRVFRVSSFNAALYTFYAVATPGSFVLLHAWVTRCKPGTPAVKYHTAYWPCPPPQACRDQATSRLESR